MSSDPRNPLLGLGQPPATLQDSLQALVGGGVPVKESTPRIEFWSLPFRLRGAIQGLLGEGDVGDRLGAAARGWRGGALLGAAFPFGDNRVLLRPDRPESEARYTRMHEFGHVSDFRKAFPEAARAVERASGNMSAREKREFYADTFAQAMRFLQNAGSQSEKEQQIRVGNMPPEQQAMVRELLRHPLYAQHPMAGQGLLGVGEGR